MLRDMYGPARDRTDVEVRAHQRGVNAQARNGLFDGILPEARVTFCAFFFDLSSSLQIYIIISSPCLPSPLQVLYLSQETAEGGPLVNAERTRQGVPPLEVRAVPLAGPEQMKQQTVAESLTTSTAGASAPASSGGPAGSSAPSVLSSSSTSTSSPSSSWSAIAASKTSSTALRLAESVRAVKPYYFACGMIE